MTVLQDTGQLFLDENEICAGMGMTQSGNDEQLSLLVKECSSVVLHTVSPRAVYSVFPFSLAEEFSGNDIKKHLEQCESVVLFAATIGNTIERLIRAASLNNTLKALVLDTCASVAIEALCNNVQEQIARTCAQQNLFCTSRFSPGYGDFDIGIQTRILSLLDSHRKIGLSCTESSILIPRKSVSAVIGLSSTAVTGALAGCQTCAIKDTCAKRKAGGSCAAEKTADTRHSSIGRT